MKRVRVVCYIGMLAVVLLAASCKSTKKVAREESAGAKNRAEFFNRFEKNAFRFETLTARLKADIDLPGKSVGSRVDMKMVKDRVFQLSVQPFLGIEVFRVMISTDSLIVLDRMNKRYVAERLETLQGQTPVDFNFYNLQALFTDRIFVPGSQSVEPKMYRHFTLEETGGNVVASVQDAQHVTYRFTVDRENKLIRTEASDRSDKYSVRWEYTGFRATGDQLFPMMMDVRLWGGSKALGGLKLGFSRVEVDKPVEIDFSVPPRYTRITFAEIVKPLTRGKK